MTLGLDLSSLQGPHRMRGIGYTLINLINNLPIEARKKHSFVFFADMSKGAPDALELLKLHDMQYELRPLHSVQKSYRVLPGKLNVIARLLQQLASLRNFSQGDNRIQDTSGIDYFLQTDQMISLPKGDFQKAFIAYDLIPYILEWDYLWNYRTARSHGLPRQAAVRCSARRWQYIRKLRTNVRHADKVFAISEATRSDYLRYVKMSKDKIITVPLGINPHQEFHEDVDLSMKRYVHTSWGYVQRPYVFDSTPYILFVGGGDKRRKLEELVAAFNHLRARGHNIRLVLAGDTMQGPMNIPTIPIQKALKDSSYIDDIVFMGFVDDRQREWLYNNALAFVYPSRYEGFGLPVLEAMQYGTPVITYKNSSIVEITGDAAMFAHDQKSLMQSIKKLMEADSLRTQLHKAGQRQAAQYSWAKTVSTWLDTISG